MFQFMLGNDTVVINTSFERNFLFMLCFIKSIDHHRQLASYKVHGLCVKSIMEFKRVMLMSSYCACVESNGKTRDSGSS